MQPLKKKKRKEKLLMVSLGGKKTLDGSKQENKKISYFVFQKNDKSIIDPLKEHF